MDRNIAKDLLDLRDARRRALEQDDRIQNEVALHIAGGAERERVALNNWRIETSDGSLHPLAFGYTYPEY